LEKELIAGTREKRAGANNKARKEIRMVGTCGYLKYNLK